MEVVVAVVVGTVAAIATQAVQANVAGDAVATVITPAATIAIIRVAVHVKAVANKVVPGHAKGHVAVHVQKYAALIVR